MSLFLLVLIALLVGLGKKSNRGKRGSPRLRVGGFGTSAGGTVVVNEGVEFTDPTCGCVWRGRKDGTNKRVRWCDDCKAVEASLRKMERGRWG